MVTALDLTRPTRARCAATVLAASVAGALLVASPPAARAQEQYAEFAQRRFLRGRELFEAGDYAGALAEFRASLALYNSPNARLYAARCLRETGQLPDAVVEFERTVLEATDRVARDERYAPTRDAAREELAALEPRVARVTVLAPAAGLPPRAAITVAGRELPAAALGVPVTVVPGRVVLAARAPGYHEARAVLELAPGARVEHALPALRRAAPAALVVRRALPPRDTAAVPAERVAASLRTAGFVAGGVGLAGATAFVVLGALTLQQNAMCSPVDRTCPDAGVIETGAALQTSANVSLGIGVAALVTGAALWLIAARVAPPWQRGVGAAASRRSAASARDGEARP